MDVKSVTMVGRWFNVSTDNKNYNVLIQKEQTSSVKQSYDPNSILVFDEGFNPISKDMMNIYDTIREIMETLYR